MLSCTIWETFLRSLLTLCWITSSKSETQNSTSFSLSTALLKFKPGGLALIPFSISANLVTVLCGRL